MKMKTLIIDDDHASIAILEALLANYCECSVATNGKNGIKLFEEEYKSGRPFEIVLLDIIMPGLDGIETLKRLRRIELSSRKAQLYGRYDGLTRIIMQTSSEDPKHFMASYMEGKCSGFINKPYSKDEIIMKVLGKTDLTDLSDPNTTGLPTFG